MDSGAALSVVTTKSRLHAWLRRPAIAAPLRGVPVRVCVRGAPDSRASALSRRRLLLSVSSSFQAFEVTKQSSAYWLGEAGNDSLQRVYGISFPDKKLMKEYKLFMKQAEERDHRRKGIEQELFFFHELSPGCAFFLPHGARIYATLLAFVRKQYRRRGYDEVITPNVYNAELWKTSGHWEHYEKNMFSFSDGEASKASASEPREAPLPARGRS